MSVRFTVTLADESTAALDADRVDVVDSGALLFAAAAEPPPAGMQEIFILSARSWRWCVADGAAVSWSNPAWDGQAVAAPTAEPKILTQAEVPDEIGKLR